ncbi:hypothetical protein FPSE5266_03283 [Fusarium pseudograminearum]|nr:hypothetical protein FPSE5266_03283 [Fusarium pseudograminearum]
MPTTKTSSTSKFKKWFRKRSKSDDSRSATSTDLSDTSTSLRSTVTQNSRPSADTASIGSDVKGTDAVSPIIPEKVPESVVINDKPADLKDENTTQKDDHPHPWKQAVSYLNEEDRVLINSVDEHDNNAKVFADLHDLIIKKKTLGEEKAWKITFGGRRIVLREVLAKIVSWLDSVKAIGDVISQVDPVHAGVPWSAIKLVLSVFTADNEQMGLLIIGMEQVICLIARCSIYHQLYLENVVHTSRLQTKATHQLSNAMARLYAKLFSFLAYYIRLLDRNSAVRMLKTFCNPSEVAAKLKEIGNLETQVTTEANVCQGTIAESAFQNMDESSRDNRQKLRDMSSRFDDQTRQLWKHLNEDERCKILQWVSDIPYESDHYIARKGRVDGTGEWLMGHEVYETWQRPDTSNLMWLNGIPGAGKTKLSSRVVDDLLARLPKEAEENYGFAYFYCDRNRPDHSEPVAIMRSIIRQLCAPRDNQSIESCVEHQYLRRKVKGFSSDRLVAEECKQLLMQLIAGYKSVYIVVDGLDECDRGTRHMLMDLLDEVIIKFQQTVKVYIASRTDQDLRKRYNEGTHLEVTANDNQADIEKFVLSKMEESEFCRTKLSRKLRDKILSTFQDKSQGMFQWATLHIGELIQLERNADIAKYLDGLPKGLEAAYDKIYGQISDLTGSKKSIAFAAFQIVMVSQRPLHPFELAIAAAQHPHHNFILDQDVDIEYVLEACQNLLVVADGSQERDVTAVPTMGSNLQGYLKQEVKVTRTSSSMAVWENNVGVTKDSICRFAHLSVQEYLETKHWSSAQAHEMMAGICLQTLLCLSLPNEVKDGQEETPGSDAGEDWDATLTLHVSHSKKRNIVKIVPDEEANRQLDASLSPSLSKGTVGEISICDTKSFPIPDPPPFECYLELVDYDIHDGHDESCLCETFEPFLVGYEGSPLQAWTTYCSHFFPNHLKDVRKNSKEGIGYTLLGLVRQFLGTPSNSTTSYMACTRLVQNTDVLDDPDRKYATGKSALRPYTTPVLGCVILDMHEVLDEWLSKREVDPNGRNMQGDSLLDLAVRSFTPDICKVLLKHGADPNLPNPFTVTPLGSAVHHANLDLVQMLVEAGADLCTSMVPISEQKEGWRGLTAPHYETPVHEAVKTGNADIVKAIVDGAKSASYHGQPLRLEKALNEAAQACRPDLAAILLSYGDNQDGHRQVMIYNALNHVPANDSGIDIMKLLMGHLKNRTHTLLNSAVKDGNWTFVEALTEMGVDVSTHRDNLYQETPLHSIFREWCGDELVKVQKIIDKGANVNTRDVHGNTPLALAMKTKIFGSKTTDHEQDGDQDEETNDTTTDESTPDISRVEAIRYLLQHGAHTDTINRNGMTLLGIACAHAVVTPEVIEILLEHGANVNATQGHGELSMSPLDALYLHDNPTETEIPPLEDDNLAVVREILKKHGARYFRAIDYEKWDIQRKLEWITKHRTGPFAVPNVTTCFTGG